MKNTVFTVCLIIVLIVPFSFAENSDDNARDAFLSHLLSPREITHMDWMLLQWQLQLEDDAMKKVLQKHEYCSFEGTGFDRELKAIVVNVICAEDILKQPRYKRLIKDYAFGYIRLFDSFMRGDNKATVDLWKELFIFNVAALGQDKDGNIVMDKIGKLRLS